MEQQRNLLLIVLLCLTMFLFWNWETDKASAAKKAEEGITTSANVSEIISESAGGKSIQLVSDNLDLMIDLNGGDIIDAKLPKILQEQGKDDPFHLLMSNKIFTYQAMSGLSGKDGIDQKSLLANKSRPTYSADKDKYELADGEDSVSAKLTVESDGVTYSKIFTLKRNSYVVDVEYQVENKSDRTISLNLFSQLKQTDDISSLKDDSSFAMVASAYRGAAYSSDNSRYEKETFSDIIDNAESKENLNVETKTGWVAMIQHYFVSAWICNPTDNLNKVIYSNASPDKTQAIIGIKSGDTEIKAGETGSFKAQLWLGPKEQDQMGAVATNLDLTVDYGWLWFISIPLFKILQFIHSILGNWGFSIIVLTLIVRSCMFPLTKAQYTSMAKMRLLTPKMQELRERYKDDRQKLGQETMRLYKSEKVNPLGGCLPMVIQMPIFIALYWTLMESTELRQSSFIFWITDLSVYDPFFVLPILYGISMFMLQKMSPTPMTDPIQRKVFMAMPLVFTFMFCTFPAGLTLYWLVSNCFTIFQQTIIFRSLEKKGLSMKAAQK